MWTRSSIGGLRVISKKLFSGEESAHVGDGTEGHGGDNVNKKEKANSKKQMKDNDNKGGDTRKDKVNGNRKKRIRRCVEAKKDNKRWKEDEKEKSSKQDGKTAGSNKSECDICGLKVTKGWSFDRHMRTQHGIEKEKRIKRECGDKGKYEMKIFEKGVYNKCPVKGCGSGAWDKSGMYRHFAMVHTEADIIITEDGELEKCFWCGMRMAFPDKHNGAYTCRRIEARNRRRRKLNKAKEKEREFAEGGEEEDNVFSALLEVEERTISDRDISIFARELRKKIRETDFSGEKGKEEKKQFEDWAKDRDWIKSQIRIEWERETLKKEWGVDD